MPKFVEIQKHKIYPLLPVVQKHQKIAIVKEQLFRNLTGFFLKTTKSKNKYSYTIIADSYKYYNRK